MQDDRGSIGLGQLVYVLRPCDSSLDGRLLSFIGQTFTGIELCSAVGELNDDRRFQGCGRFENGIDSVRTGDIYRR